LKLSSYASSIGWSNLRPTLRLSVFGVRGARLAALDVEMQDEDVAPVLGRHQRLLHGRERMLDDA
jgi:hypothetical protein